MNRSQSSVLCGLGRQKVFTFLSHSHLQFINIFLPFFCFQLYQNFLLLSPKSVSSHASSLSYVIMFHGIQKILIIAPCAVTCTRVVLFHTCWNFSSAEIHAIGHPCPLLSLIVCWFLRAVFQFIYYFWVWWQHMACCPPFSAVCIIFLRSHYCVAESHSLHWRSQTWRAY